MMEHWDPDSSPLSSGEFQSFAMSHPEYAKLFTTYLELQRYQAIQEADPGALQLSGQSLSDQEDSVSDKKDDWSCCCSSVTPVVRLLVLDVLQSQRSRPVLLYFWILVPYGEVGAPPPLDPHLNPAHYLVSWSLQDSCYCCHLHVDLIF